MPHLSGSQNPTVLNFYDPLVLDSTNQTLPKIDTGNLVATYPMSQEWLDPQQLNYSYTNSINGGTLSVVVADTFNRLTSSKVLDVSQIQSWTGILRLYGGSTTPIRVRIMLTDTNGLTAIWFIDQVNPSNVYFSNLMCGPGYDIRIDTLDNGGAADNIDWRLYGFQARPGVEMPNMTTSFQVMP